MAKAGSEQVPKVLDVASSLRPADSSMFNAWRTPSSFRSCGGFIRQIARIAAITETFMTGAAVRLKKLLHATSAKPLNSAAPEEPGTPESESGQGRKEFCMSSRPGSTRRRRDSRGAVRWPTMRCLCTLVGLALLAALLPPGAATAEAWTSIYSGSETVTGPGVDDPNPVELGVRFTVSTPGHVSAIRYYKTSGNTGVHVGSLWTSHGRRLAKVTFSSETATGWQVARLAEPIPLRPGRTYVASYHTNTGRYAAKVGVFANGATIGNSTIRATSGVRRYGAGGFPSTRKAAAYFVDVFFTPQASASIGSDPTPSQSHRDAVCAFDLYTDLDAYTGTTVSATPTVGTSPTVVGATPTSTPTDTAAPSTAPGALNLPRIPWEGGPNYWKSSPSRPQFAKADAAGWDDPHFSPSACSWPTLAMRLR